MQAALDIDDLTSEAPIVLTLPPHDLADLADEVQAYHAHFAPLSQRREQRAWAAVYLRGLLLTDVPRKNVEAMALRLQGAGPAVARTVRAPQQFVGEGAWDDAALLSAHQDVVAETLGEDDGVLIIDGSDVMCPNKAPTRSAWRGSGAGPPARRTTARPASIWAMPAAAAIRCWIAVSICMPPGSPRSTRNCGGPAGSPRG